MSDTLDLVGLAAALGRSYDWTQRHWRALRDREALPSPYIGDQRGQQPRWHAPAVLAWKAQRSGAAITPHNLAQSGEAEPAPVTPANDPVPMSAAPGDRVSKLLAAAGG